MISEHIERLSALNPASLTRRSADPLRYVRLHTNLSLAKRENLVFLLMLHLQEASSGIVELEDDPEIVKLFLQFLYTGNYDNGITPTNGLPSVPAMMTPEEVSEELSVSPGVFIPENINERGEVGQRAAEPDDDKDATENGEDDGDYGEAFDYELEEGEEDPSPSDAPEEYAEFGQFENVENLKADTTTKPLPTSGPEAEAIVHAEFLVPLRLYVMADRFDVPALKLLARDRFYRAAESRWEALLDFFPKVIAEIYRTTSPADTAIREIVCRLVGARIRDEHIREALRPVMCEFGEFAVGVMEYSLYFLKLVE